MILLSLLENLVSFFNIIIKNNIKMKNNKFNSNNSNIENNNSINTRIIPVITYTNADTNKCNIYEENRNKSGVYRWVNKINGKSYVGSSISLSNTFSIYYSLSSLKIKVNGSIIIDRALLKYGYSNFSLDILEYCEPSELIKREQYYIDLFKPEYNIKITSSNSKIGFKHSEDNVSLNPDFVTGLTDAEGCFSVSITVSVNKGDKAKYKRSIKLTFIIKMLKNEIELLSMVKSFFDCGTLYHNKDGSVDFKIQDFYSLKNKVIPHFLKYPLRGTKYLDFISFKEAFNIIESKKHLREEGTNKLYILKKGMNSHREFPLNTYYCPNHTQKGNIDYIPINGHYINGFIAGDGCLSLHMGKHFGSMHLQISQHKNNKLLMMSIANYFASPSKVYLQGSNCLQINLGGIKLWVDVLFKHFEKYPLYGRKIFVLNKLFLIRELKIDNKHLIRIGRSSQWKSEYKLRVEEIWKS